MQDFDVARDPRNTRDIHAVTSKSAFKAPLPFKVPSYFIEACIFAVLLIATAAINLRMIRDGTNGLGDVRWHLTWLQHFSKQLSEGIWYPRWLAGTNFGYGSPTFVFYPPLVYYIGTGIKALGLNFEQTVSALFSGGIFFSGLSFYIFARNYWGRFPSLFGALTYILTPGFIFLTNGGGLTSLYAFIWLPLLLHLTYKAAHQAAYGSGLALVWALMALTHLPSLLISATAWLIYTIIWFHQSHQSWQVRLRIWLAAPLGWGLAAYFLIPAVLEQRYINIDYMLASQAGFRTSMPNLVAIARQGLSDLSVRQWLACFSFAGIALIGYSQHPRQQRTVWAVLLTAVGVVLFMSDWAWPVWEINPVLQKIESSVRISTVLYLSEAVLCALAVQSLQYHRWRLKRFSQMLMLVIVCAILFSNFKYGFQFSRKNPGLHSSGNGVMVNRPWIEKIINDPFSDRLIDVPEYRPRLSQNQSLENSSYIKEELTKDGLPVVRESVSGLLPTPQLNQPQIEIAQGKADFAIASSSSYHRRFNLTANEPTTVIARLYYYPAWHLYLNGAIHPIEKASDGRILFRVAAGQYDIDLVYQKTPAFKLGIALSLLSLIALIGLAYAWKPRKFGR
jgi:hypothetical protein